MSITWMLQPAATRNTVVVASVPVITGTPQVDPSVINFAFGPDIIMNSHVHNMDAPTSGNTEHCCRCVRTSYYRNTPSGSIRHQFRIRPRHHYEFPCP